MEEFNLGIAGRRKVDGREEHQASLGAANPRYMRAMGFSIPQIDQIDLRGKRLAFRYDNSSALIGYVADTAFE